MKATTFQILLLVITGLASATLIHRIEPLREFPEDSERKTNPSVPEQIAGIDAEPDTEKMEPGDTSGPVVSTVPKVFCMRS